MPVSRSMEHQLVAESTFARNALTNGAISPHVPSFHGSFLWDTALIAEGLSTVDPSGAAQQIATHLQGQHLSGMLPNEVIYDKLPFIPRHLLHYKEQGRGVYASNITQPPTIVTAAWEVAQRLPKDDRTEFLKECFPILQTYLGWLMTSRVDSSDGLVMLTQPHESGMDDNPVWGNVLEREWAIERLSSKERLVLAAGTKILPRLRKKNGDFQDSRSPERADDNSVLLSYLQSALAYKLRGNPHQMLEYGKGTVVKDVGFNALAVEACRSLINIEAVLHNDWYRVDDQLYESMGRLERALEATHYDETTGTYHSIDVRTGSKLPAITASSLLPLLHTRSAIRQDELVAAITNPNAYWTALPIPSVRADSDEFTAGRYWQGGSWPFMRYQIERALRRQGKDMFAAALRSRVIYNPHASEASEFNNPLNGTPLGVRPFSPAAAELLLYSKIEARKG